MPVFKNSRYNRPEVKVLGIIGRDGEVRKWLTLRNPLSRDDFTAGTNRIRKAGEELDLIAYEEFGDSRLWYIIAEVNNIPDPTSVPAGTTLFIPSLREVLSLPAVS